ncbi:succinate dehydrogenase subunit C [Paenibacillus sp. ov031]|uniref:Succinate dehydrogenase subunit C n=2 Tax=Paenibacillus TaxID=44249 RepID=A0A855Y1G0_9BACL|nr:Succinate dehydrogenase cytochrome b558 subunit [Paenibacillus sp. AD87]PWW35593.1 succinate dehydrogenase subunit C [Paenibacillus pabuli]PXW02739.1 succinate dehydrogenase subunit C [Paenibacillus taichungensis]SDM00714.1 succinate dehydrogenase subunit C [Paenibacillus sp. OK060]SEL70494.1 succinate dehydrogenase subunit C [Paenibacillus sp. OK003]SHN83509.1 succinate dehydrogenase subunit C [Paenibacillus sp. ov031]SLK15074.1 succinate dehydrogenase subunit C [Paenibacillus sp. RU5A]S
MNRDTSCSHLKKTEQFVEPFLGKGLCHDKRILFMKTLYLAKGDRHFMKGFYSRKLHSLLGVIPLSLFFIEHMVTNFSAVEGGKEGFNDAVAFLNGLPLVIVLETLLIWLPLFYHGVYGLYIAYQAKPNVGRFGNERNWRYTLQRVSGVITFVFVIWHIWETRFQVALGNVTHEELGGVIHGIVMNPVTFILYLISVVAASYHFANGLWSFLVSWGITVGPRAQRVSSYICMSLFAIVAIMFIVSLLAFRSMDFQVATSMIDAVKTVLI